MDTHHPPCREATGRWHSPKPWRRRMTEGRVRQSPPFESNPDLQAWRHAQPAPPPSCSRSTNLIALVITSYSPPCPPPRKPLIPTHAHPPLHLPQEKALPKRSRGHCRRAGRRHHAAPLSLRSLPSLSSDRPDQRQAPPAGGRIGPCRCGACTRRAGALPGRIALPRPCHKHAINLPSNGNASVILRSST